MKKKNFYIILIVVISIGLMGCNKKNIITYDKNSTNEMVYQNETIEDYIKSFNYTEIEFICDDYILKEISHFGYLSSNKGTESFFVTNSGNVYKTYNGKKYSNDKNCIQIEKKGANYPMSSINHYFDQYDRLKKDYPTSKALYKAVGNNDFILIDNSIFISHIPYDFDDNTKKIYEKVKIDLENDEEILGFYGSWDYPVLKTNKKYYYFFKKIINNCNEYADVECEYEYFFEVDKISKYYDMLKYYDGHIILTTENKLFSRDSV